jgi:hypothetical protein
MKRGTGIQLYFTNCGTYPYSVKNTLLLKKLNCEIADRFEGFTLNHRSPSLLNFAQSGSLNVIFDNKIVIRICRMCQRVFLMLFCAIIVYNVSVIVHYSIRKLISLSHKLLIADVGFHFELIECT